MEKLYSIRDLCEIMGVCRHTFYHWKRRGIIQSIKVGGTVRIRESEINRILAVNTPTGTTNRMFVSAVKKFGLCAKKAAAAPAG